MNRGKISHCLTSVIIDDFDHIGSIVTPLETDSPLLIDADGMLPFSVTAQYLQAVGRRNPKIIQRCCKMEHGQFTCRQSLNILRELLGEAPLENFFGFPALETFDHSLIITCEDNSVKVYYER